MLALRHFVLLPLLCTLAACSVLPTLNADEQVLFSHSDPIPTDIAMRRNTWSPSQWHEVSLPNEPTQAREPVETLREMVLYFETDSDQLTQPELDRLSKFMDLINLAKQPRFLLVGHTDSRFTTSHNQSLSARRAETVLTLLVAFGIDQRRISVQARGLQEPASSNDTDMGRAQNRRVTLTVSE
jgi:outer membrane protein OmpA-like peptidoglycan-associated protein